MAAKPSATVRIVFDRILATREDLGAAIQAAVDQTAFAIQADAQRTAPYKTGTLRRSIHTITPTTSGYAGASRGVEPRQLVAEAPKPPTGSAIVGVAVNYGKFVELGTRYMAARPYLIPALEREAPKLVERIRRLARFR